MDAVVDAGGGVVSVVAGGSDVGGSVGAGDGGVVGATEAGAVGVPAAGSSASSRVHHHAIATASTTSSVAVAIATRREVPRECAGRARRSGSRCGAGAVGGVGAGAGGVGAGAGGGAGDTPDGPGTALPGTGGGSSDIGGTVPQRPVRSAVVSVPSEPQPSGDIELAIVTLRFDAADAAALVAVLSKYVVLTRMEPGCRNVDLCASVTRPGRYLVIQKWESAEAQRAHFDGAVMVEMARACTGLLSAPPDIDLWDGPSAHDLA